MIMEKEALEALDTPDNNLTVEYELPKFHRRVLANLIDIILFALIFFFAFIPTNAIVKNTSAYKNADAVLVQYREDSGLFQYSTDRKIYELITTWYDNNDDVEYPVRVIGCEMAINDFQNYVKTNFGDTSEEYTEVIKDYDDSRLGEAVVYKKIPLFIKSMVDTDDDDVLDTEKIIRNPEATSAGADSKVYYKTFYKLYIETNANGYLITLFPNYYHAIKTESNFLFFCEVPISFVLAGLIVYFLPGVIFRRGRMSFGKKLYHIGLVDSRVLSPSFGRYLSRFAIFFFGELTLSFFTFGVPFIVSFSMMVFSKKKQGFPDYLLGLTEVDESKAKIYYTKYEAALDQMKEAQGPVNFKMKDNNE